jgi:hypothetical protein
VAPFDNLIDGKDFASRQPEQIGRDFDLLRFFNTPGGAM